MHYTCYTAIVWVYRNRVGARTPNKACIDFLLSTMGRNAYWY